MALPRGHRVQKTAELKVLRHRGRIYDSPHLSVRVAPGSGATWRVAVVVSNRVAGTAAQRNKIKRTISEAIRISIPTDAPVNDVFISVRQPLDERALAGLRNELWGVLRKSGML